MGRSLQIALTILVSTVALAVGIGIWGAFGLNQHLIATVDHVGDTLDAVNRPCENGKPCGLIAKTDQTLNELDSAIVHADLVARHEQQQLVTYDRYTAELMAKISGVADSLQKAADATTQTAQAASVALGTANDTIKGLQPLETNLAATAEASTATIKTFNGRLSDPRVDKLLTDFNSIADSGAVIAAQGAIITTDLRKEADNLVAPKPLWQKLIPGAELGGKIWACVFEHVCVD
jgi:hypothetical protein